VNDRRRKGVDEVGLHICYRIGNRDKMNKRLTISVRRILPLFLLSREDRKLRGENDWRVMPRAYPNKEDKPAFAYS